MIILIVIGAILAIAFLALVLPGFFIIGAQEVGILTRRNFGKRLPEGDIIATKGEVGIQAKTLMPGFYWRFPILWKAKKVKVVVINPNEVGLIKSIAGKTLSGGNLLGDEVDCDSFQDAEAFLNNGGHRGPQRGILNPGTYRINLLAFEVSVVKAVTIDDNQIGIVVALDGIPLPPNYVIAPQPVDKDDKPISDPRIFQEAQRFIDSKGYRGPQLDTLQPGTYYINRYQFDVAVTDVQDVAPGYVAVIRSNVGIELDRTETERRKENATPFNDSKVVDNVESLLIQDKYARGIWCEPIAPGKYNMNPLAYTAYHVPTSAITIDWADEGKIGTEVIGTKTGSVINEGVLYHFDPLKVTSKDGFQLKVNVRMVIRVTPENAAFMIARFGSVDNLIDQIVHPLIDSSFRNKAGEKKAIDFFQSRTELQKEALEHAREVFDQYNVEAQNLLVAYIDVPQSLLDTQTAKEIALQQKEQFTEQAKAQEKNIEVQEKTARANKQIDVVNAELEVEIQKNKADAKEEEARGQSTYLQKTEAAKGKGIAEGLEAQKNALGEQGTAALNIFKALSEHNMKIVPDIQAGGGGGLLDVLMAQIASGKSASITASVGDDKK